MDDKADSDKAQAPMDPPAASTGSSKARLGSLRPEAAAQEGTVHDEPDPGTPTGATHKTHPAGREDTKSAHLVVVGIGSSAGGLEATKELIARLGKRPGVAVVLVPHMDPTHESHLSEILQKTTAMKVTQVTDGMTVEPDHVYVIPPDSAMVIEDGVLRLHERDGTNGGFVHVVDRFFRSLAEDLGPRAMGVVLSGTLADGTQGLREIKATGGITFAQDPKSAQFREMPHNAITGSHPDVVAGAEQIAAAIVDVARRLRDEQDPFPAQGSAGGEDEDGLALVTQALHRRIGVDFSQYKRTTLSRRIQRRMFATGKPTLHSYAALVEASMEEARALQEEILIHVTQFFREPETYDSITRHVLPRLLEDQPEERPIRIWVPGCATGEEAYSIAIAVSEFLEENKSRQAVQVFATDLSESAIKTAREGLYPDTIVEDVSEERLVRHFERDGSGYRVRKHLRGLCVFATHNLIVDPPFSGLDLVSLRNVLVYMESPLQRRILATIHYALRPGRLLVLGSSESVGRSKDLFEPHPETTHVYMKRDVAPPPFYELTGRDFAQQGSLSRPGRSSMPDEEQIRREADRVLIDRYAPPGVVVNKDLRIVHFRGETARYLQHASGPASLDLMRMASEPLAVEVRSLVSEAKEKGRRIRRENVRTPQLDKTTRLTLEAVPLGSTDQQVPFFLVTFHESPVPGGRQQGPGFWSTLLEGLGGPQGAAGRKIERLERELAAAKEHLQFIIEDYEATMEELRSANEEALSANEELQSTNEELETTKEELQSANEELRSLNDELQQRSLDVQSLNNDLLNLINSIGIPVVMLGPDLSIRRFTPKAQEFLNLISTDIGRPFTDIQPPFEASGIRAAILHVLENYTPQEISVQDKDSGHWRLQFHPYRTTDHKVDGVVMIAIKAPTHSVNSG